jgi:hypothetical protein
MQSAGGGVASAVNSLSPPPILSRAAMARWYWQAAAAAQIL